VPYRTRLFFDLQKLSEPWQPAAPNDGSVQKGKDCCCLQLKRDLDRLECFKTWCTVGCPEEGQRRTMGSQQQGLKFTAPTLIGYPTSISKTTSSCCASQHHGRIIPGWSRWMVEWLNGDGLNVSLISTIPASPITGLSVLPNLPTIF